MALATRVWNGTKYIVNDKNGSMKLAGKNVATVEDPRKIPLTKLAVKMGFDPEKVDAYLGDKSNYAIVTMNIKGKGKVEREVRRNLTLSSPVDPVLFCAVTKAAYERDGGGAASEADDITSGYVGVEVRRDLYAGHLAWTDDEIETFERERAERISRERSERMSNAARERGLSESQVKMLNAFETLRGNDKLMAALAQSNPDVYEILMLGADDTES